MTERRFALTLVVCVVGCATTGATAPERARVRFVAEGTPAPSYSTVAPGGAAATGPHAARVEAAVARGSEARGSVLTPDPRLAVLAGWALAHQVARSATPPHAVIDLWTRHLGLVEPAPHLLVLGVSDSQAIEDRVGAEVEDMLARHRYTHWGAATDATAGQQLVVVALSWRWLTLGDVPRRVAPGASVALRGRLDDDLAGPELAVTPPSGATWRRPVGAGPAFDVSVALDAPGHHRIEILAHGAQGPTVVANFPVSAGVEPPRSVEVEVGGGAPDADEAVRELLALIQRDRGRAGLPPLEHDAALAAVARGHSLDMHEHDFVAHTSPTTGSADDRVAAAGIRTRLVLENIGQGYGPEEVHEGLMQSPGHRESVLSPDATHVGIGVLTDREDGQTRYLVTELFIRRARPIDVDAAPDDLLDRINAARARRGLAPLALDDALSAPCRRAATDYFATDASHEALATRVGKEAKALRPPYRSLAAAFVVVAALEEAATVEGFLDPQASGIGLGIAQGTRADGEPNAIAVVAVLGRPR